MARDFAASSTDEISIGNVTPTTIFSSSVWCYFDAYSTTSKTVWGWQTSGNSRLLTVDAVNRLVITRDFTTTNGEWRIDGIAVGGWHNITFTYDGGAEANNPIVYFDGVSQSVTTQVTPVGTVVNASDEIILGNRADG